MYRDAFSRRKLNLVNNQQAQEQFEQQEQDQEQFEQQEQDQEQFEQQDQFEQQEQASNEQEYNAVVHSFLNASAEDQFHGRQVLSTGVIANGLSGLIEQRSQDGDAQNSYTVSLLQKDAKELCYLLAAEAAKLANNEHVSEAEDYMHKFADIMYLSFVCMKKHNISSYDVMKEIGYRVADSDGAEFLDQAWQNALSAATTEVHNVANQGVQNLQIANNQQQANEQQQADQNNKATKKKQAAKKKKASAAASKKKRAATSAATKKKKAAKKR